MGTKLNPGRFGCHANALNALSSRHIDLLFICGPQASGKTRHADQLLAHYGRKRVVDDFYLYRGKPASDVVFQSGDLVLTYESEEAICRLFPFARILSITEALSALPGSSAA